MARFGTYRTGVRGKVNASMIMTFPNGYEVWVLEDHAPKLLEEGGEYTRIYCAHPNLTEIPDEETDPLDPVSPLFIPKPWMRVDDRHCSSCSLLQALLQIALLPEPEPCAHEREFFL